MGLLTPIPQSVMDSIDGYIANQVDPSHFAPAQEPINDGIAATGTSAETTTTYLEYAYNVITTATDSDYGCRLPNPPVKGKSCTVINTSNREILVFPAVDGESINNVIDGSITIPNDALPYVFFCYEDTIV
jgi:hypothetical protein